MKQLVLLFITIFMIGCGSSGIDLKPNEKLSTQSYSISITGNGWWTGQKVEDRMLKFQGMYDRLWFSRHLPNMMSEDVRITVGIPERLKESTDKFFIKNFNYEKWAQEVLVRSDIVANMKERGVTYSKKYVDYIGGLKCGTDVESSNLALGVGSKRYYTVCGYYDVNGAKKRIDIFYNYTYTHSGTKYDSDKKSSSVTPQAMQKQFKQDIKAIFDSLVIHDMDRERMSKEGLLHSKKYDIDSEFR